VTEQRRQKSDRDSCQDVTRRDARQQPDPSDLYLKDGEDYYRDEERPQILQPALGEKAAGNKPP
jgi:hypothetical protein